MFCGFHHNGDIREVFGYGFGSLEILVSVFELEVHTLLNWCSVNIKIIIYIIVCIIVHGILTDICLNFSLMQSNRVMAFIIMQLWFI